MCEAVVPALQSQSWYDMSMLLQVQTQLEFQPAFQEALPEIEKIMCALPGMNISEIYGHIEKSNIMSLVEKVKEINHYVKIIFTLIIKVSF